MSGVLSGILIFVIGTIVTYGLLMAIGSGKSAGHDAGHGHGGHGHH
jgi:hypothetical protein